MSERTFTGDHKTNRDRSRRSSLAPQLQNHVGELAALQTSGQPVPSETWNSVEAIAKMLASSWEAVEWDAVAELFRFLRNAFAGSSENAAAATSNKALLQTLETLVKGLCELHIKDVSHAECVVGLRCSLQCLGNLVCSDPSAGNFVWMLLVAEEAKMCTELLKKSPDVKVRQYSSMVLYNCLSPERTEHFLKLAGSIGAIESLADMVANTESEWSLFLLERLLQRDDMMPVFLKLSARYRCVLLDIAADQLTKVQVEGASLPISLPLLEHVQSDLLGKVKAITMCAETTTTGDPEISEICKLLKVLCLASANEKLKNFFSDGAELLATALEVLKMVHTLGKSGKNAFTPAQHLDDFTEVDKGASEVTVHPSFGLKRDLVQLIGNMCHQNRKHQDLVRNLEGMPVILDVCNLDAKNPFIIQYAILAIKNLLEGNLENQDIVASLIQQGVVTDAPLIKEMGIKFE